jgi:hypothetical protein
MVNLQSNIWSHHASRLNEGGSCTQVSRPVDWKPGAPEGALRTATIKVQAKNGLTHELIVRQSNPGD